MVVGIVVGSGVFFKAQTILQKNRRKYGDGYLGVADRRRDYALLYRRLFRLWRRNTKKVNGVVDYAEATVGRKYGCVIGWFMTMIYYPTLTSVLAWLSARYTLVFLTSAFPNRITLVIPAAEGLRGFELEWRLLCSSLCAALRDQRAFTEDRGTLPGGNDHHQADPAAFDGSRGYHRRACFRSGRPFWKTWRIGRETTGNPLFGAIVATAFAYEGWIIATSINAELKDAKRNLPIALIAGGIIVWPSTCSITSA